LWRIDETNKVTKQLKKLGSIERKKYRNAITDLYNSGDPRGVGEYKRNGYYAYRITDSCRLIYRVTFNEKVITLISVGDHKKVYGKD
jgi:mRNA-degrading endonuclease RelE of RelBE toxin-antitoxin system